MTSPPTFVVLSARLDQDSRISNFPDGTIGAVKPGKPEWHDARQTPVLLDSRAMHALYYPFHLCHERILYRLLEDYESLHFRDFMALQLTPFMGTTAFPDRMGDYYPELLETGRIVQGHNVSGSMSRTVIDAVDRDLADSLWRSLFHAALQHDYRFQRGLFGVSELPRIGSSVAGHTSVLSKFASNHWPDKPYRVDTVKTLSRTSFTQEDGPGFEYGWALVKTAAALVYTIRLCHQFELSAVTDSPSHSRLLAQTCERDHLELSNACVAREGY